MIRAVHTADLGPGELDEVRALLHAAFDGDVDETDVAHALGGMHVLVEPPNDGVGKLSWLVPYAAGMTGMLLAGFVAVRWSRRGSDADALAAGTPRVEDATLSSRLDDELRDLD